MIPEILVASLGPVVAGVFGVFVLGVKRTPSKDNQSIEMLKNELVLVSHKLDNIGLDVAKNYATNEDISRVVNSHEDFKSQFSKTISEIHQEIRELRIEFRDDLDRYRGLTPSQPGYQNQNALDDIRAQINYLINRLDQNH